MTLFEDEEGAASDTSGGIREFRRFYASYVAEGATQNKARIRAAFMQIDRERFVGPGPWQVAVPNGYISTETDDPRLIYQDILIGLDTDKGINTGIPSLHARCLDQVNPKPGNTVVHVGTGSGYYTAILASLVGIGGFVHGYEIDSALAARATENLRDISNIAIHAESALTILPKADVIYVCASLTHPPSQWLDALAIGGRLMLPLEPEDRFGCVALITRRSSVVYAARIFAGASFIPCVGGYDPAAAQILTTALNVGNAGQVRSLHRNNQPDSTAWCIGSDWWLSTEECD